MSPREAAARHRKGLLAYCAAVLAWTLSFMTALVLLPPGAHTSAVAHADATSVTVPGPQRLDPATGQLGARGTVTVSQAQNLTDQMLHVSWTGFTPSTGGVFVAWSNSASMTGVAYPVIVYECRGLDPLITDCYSSSHYNQDPRLGFRQKAANPDSPDFPKNAGIAVTAADGTGSVDLEAYTANQAPTLGCDAAHQCSIVVEPDYGGDALGYNTADGSPNCDDHSLDTVASGFGQATAQSLANADADDDDQAGEQCAWGHRTVIPIRFAPVPASCAAGATDVSGEGAPLLDRALTQWIVGSCLAGNHPLTVNASSGLTEPQARGDFLKGADGADLAFTSLPADPAAASVHPYTYVPIGNVGIAVAFYIDDPVTNLPITSVKLNARLMAKLLTQSYDYFYGTKASIKSVAGNPLCVLSDPEFVALNPPHDGITWPTCNSVGMLNTLPIVAGGKTDLAHELTAWIMSDKDARDFLSGKPDPWQMHVNSFYKTSVYPYPVDGFVPQDGSGTTVDGAGLPIDPKGANRDYDRFQGFEWNPIQSGLDDVARHLLQFTSTYINPDLANGQHSKPAPETFGSRVMFAVMDTGRAAAYSLPTASLPNGTGAYVTPTVPAMASAAQDYVTDAATGTQSLPWGADHTAYAGDAAAYPLTVPAYAMAPTAGIPAAKATKLADFLTAVTDNRSGQAPGSAPGALAPGYVPNTAAQAKQAGAAIARVRPHAAPGGGSTVTVTATGPVPTGGVTGVPTTSGTVVTTPVTVVSDGKTTVYNVTSTIGGTATGGGNGDTGGGDPTSQPGGSSAAAKSTSKGAAGGSSGPTRSLSGSTTPAAAVVGTAAPDTAGPARFLLPTLLVIGVVLVAAGPAGLLLSAPGGLGARIRALRPRPKRRFGR